MLIGVMLRVITGDFPRGGIADLGTGGEGGRLSDGDRPAGDYKVTSQAAATGSASLLLLSSAC